MLRPAWSSVQQNRTSQCLSCCATSHEVTVPLIAMTLLLVQVTTCPIALQVKPPPLPLTKLKPAGGVSSTVTGPLVAAVPVLVTTKV